ncbi:hypothetical protein [Pasteuria penetrans]|uniref:hypothetical protein n=1 Tax=Pasteuria penetrans TaxID=86005 RepID=UPI00165C28EC|nr:hypothetical protein [Pasteuria penetrans]
MPACFREVQQLGWKLPEEETGMKQATSDQNPDRYNIQQKEVLKAWHQVMSNDGGPGVDQQTITAFAYDLRSNLYVIWNQLCAGSYFPSKVRRVWIPKSCGGKRPLGIYPR